MSLLITPIYFRLSKSLFVTSFFCCSTFPCCKLFCFFAIFKPSCTCSCSRLSKREWGFHVVHSILLCKSYYVHVPWGVPSRCLEHCFWILWLVNSFVEVSFNLFFFCNLWILNIGWSSAQLFIIGYVYLISLILWEMHTLWGSSYYIGLLIFFLPFRQSMPMGERFRGFKGIWFCSLFPCILSYCVAWLLNSLYKPS